MQTESDGFHRVGTVEFKGDRVELARNLFTACLVIGYVAMTPLRGRIEPAMAIGLVYGIILPIGIVAYYLIPKVYVRSSRYRVTVHLDSGKWIRLKYRDENVKALAERRCCESRR